MDFWTSAKQQSITTFESVKVVYFVVFIQLVVYLEDSLPQFFEQLKFSDFLSEVGILGVSKPSSWEILLIF